MRWRLAVPEAAVPEAVVPEAVVPEAAVPVPVPEAAVPEVAVPELAVPEAVVLELAEPEAVVPVRQCRRRRCSRRRWRRCQCRQAVLVLQAVAEVEQLAEAVRLAAQAEPLRPARAMARPVPVSVEAAVETAPLAQWVRRVRSVPLPARRAWALPQAVAHPMGRRRMGRPRGRTARREASGGWSWGDFMAAAPRRGEAARLPVACRVLPARPV